MQIEKKHFFAVALASVFIFPIAAFPKESGEVLGINDVRNSSGQVSVSSDIASGARDVAQSELKGEKEEVFGKALWDSKQKVMVSSNKFSSGTLVEVEYAGKTTEFLVEGQRDDLSEETVLILNTKAFLEIGGNPEIESSADVEVSRVK